MFVSLVQRYGKLLTMLFAGLVLLFVVIAGVNKMQAVGFVCKDPQGYSRRIAEVYSYAVVKALNVVPYKGEFITEDNDPRKKNVMKEIDEITRKASKQMKQCAVGYFKMDQKQRKRARGAMYALVKSYRKTQEWQNFNKAVEKNTAIKRELIQFRNMTRYGFVLPHNKRENYNK